MTNKMISVFNESLQQLSNRRLLIRQVEATDPKVMGDAVNKYENLSMCCNVQKRIVQVPSTLHYCSRTASHLSALANLLRIK